MQGKVEIAGVNTAKLKVLKNEETMELLRRTKAAGKQQAIRASMGRLQNTVITSAGRSICAVFHWAVSWR